MTLLLDTLAPSNAQIRKLVRNTLVLRLPRLLLLLSRISIRRRPICQLLLLLVGLNMCLLRLLLLSDDRVLCPAPRRLCRTGGSWCSRGVLDPRNGDEVHRAGGIRPTLCVVLRPSLCVRVGICRVWIEHVWWSSVGRLRLRGALLWLLLLLLGLRRRSLLV
ncbi:hypothetical protein BXZ70DRAFT_923239 [Cristinia sonorae]|uniref:Uncharacterized protein n=1 Tax=Cristinia sonorae TaxID=1940300 RepID=A0A8K0XSF5_9AGAR|nr:hypothetical protein BXZ70DRAFT_923239 [Cristinia sonorae]